MISVKFVVSPLQDGSTALALFKNLQETGIKVTDIIGEKETTEIYKKLFNSSSMSTIVFMNQGIYRCSQVLMPQLDNSLVFRRATSKDTAIIGQWLNDFHLEATPHDPPVDGIEIAKTRIKNRMIYLLERDHQPISMAACSRDIETSCSVNLVYTPVEFRKNGFASLVTAKLTHLILSNGRRETNLYTDMSNPTSNRIYTNIGYEFVCYSSHFGVC